VTQPAQAPFDALYDVVSPLYEAGRYDDALEVLAQRAHLVEGHGADVAHVTACVQALAGEPEDALATLRAALDRGEWWHERILLADDDLASVRELDGFDALVRESQARCVAANADRRPEPPVLLRADGEPRGVLVVLHGSGQAAAATAHAWSAARAAGWTLLAPQSSQHSTPTHTSWPEPGPAARDVAAALTHLDERDASLPVVAAGFSAGARAALVWALGADPVPVAGVLSVAPYVLPDQLPAVPRRTAGLVLVGAADGALPYVRGIEARLADAGVRVEVVDGLGHAYPDDFATRLPGDLARLVGAAR
jgi:predicted esterase